METILRSPLADAETRKKLLEEYAAGKSVKELVEAYKVTEGHIYKVASESGVKRGRAPSEPVEKPETEPAPPAIPAAKAGPPATIVAPPTGGVCPLFPSTKTNQVDHLMVRRVICEPPHEGARYGTGIVLDHADPALSEADLKISYGGGRYEIKALNGRGECLVTRIVRINGVKSKPIDAYDTTEDEKGAAMFVPGIPGASGASSVHVFSNMMEKVLERMDRRDEQVNQRFERLAEERAREQSAMRETELRLITDHHKTSIDMMREMNAKRDSGGSPLEQMTTFMTLFKTMKDFAGDNGEDDRDPVSAAISAAPDIIGNLAALIHGGKGPELELEAAPSPPKQLPRPQVVAAPKPPAADYGDIAKSLFQKLVADGVPQEQAKNLVTQGFTLIDSQVKNAQKKAAPVQAARPTNGVAPRAEIKPHPVTITEKREEP